MVKSRSVLNDFLIYKIFYFRHCTNPPKFTVQEIFLAIQKLSLLSLH